MRQIMRMVSVAAALGLVCGGCASTRVRSGAGFDSEFLSGGTDLGGHAAYYDSGTSRPTTATPRKVSWVADVSVQVPDVGRAVAAAVARTASDDGFVEQNVADEDRSATLVLRIPSPKFDASMAHVEGLGKLLRRNVAGKDVTDETIDVEARLKNKRATRDRLKELLGKAVEVKDVLMIETEFERVQSEIDSLEGRIKALQGQVEYATVVLRLEKAPKPPKKRILGPLGYLLHGTVWIVEKLFVIRE